MTDRPAIGTLGELRAAGYRSRSVKEEMRANLVDRLRRGETVGAAALSPLYLRPSEAELRRRVLAGA